MYAGQLCATQIGGRLEPDDGDIEGAPILVRVIHGSNGGRLPARLASLRKGTPVRMVLRDAGTHAQWVRDVSDGHAVRAEREA